MILAWALPRQFFFCIAFLMSSQAVAKGQSLFIQWEDQPKQVLTLQNILKSKKVVDVTVKDHLEKREVTFRAVDLRELLQSQWGSQWKQAEEIELVCADGYRPILPMAPFRKFRSLLAYRRMGQKEFQVKNKRKGGRVVELSPFYLIWDNLNHPEIDKMGGSLWSYQVVGVILKKQSSRFQNLKPPVSAKSSVKKGFAHLKQHCSSCHALKGVGGTVGPDLLAPVAATTKLKREWLIQWIENPQSFDPKSQMSALSWSYPNQAVRRQVIEEMLSYLEFQSARAKVKK